VSEPADGASPGGPPYGDLYIYYVEGRVDGDPIDAGRSYIGTWVEDGCSFLFFSEAAMDIVERVLLRRPDLVLIDAYRMRYEDWLGETFKRFAAGSFLVVPSWDDSPDDPSLRRIVLDPGVVFGTGTHPTTRDCLALIETVCGEAPVHIAVDVGTGTGLLALAAARAGCGRVLAFDLNLLAAKTARRNVALNRLEDNILVFQADALDAAVMPADLMIANIHYDVMARLLAAKAFLQKRWVILSGLLRSEAAEVERMLSGGPVEIVEKRERDGIWQTLLGKVRL